MQAILRQSSDARNADSLVFARRDIFVAARANQHRAARGFIHPFARLIGFCGFFWLYFEANYFSY